MSCNDVCMTVDFEGGSTDFMNEAIRTARKTHKCFECGDLIVAGDRYEYVAGKFDGDFFEQKTCLSCSEIAQTFYCGGRMFGTLWDDVREQIFPEWNAVVAIDCLARLKTDAAIQKMRARYARWNGDEPDATPTPSDNTPSNDSPASTPSTTTETSHD